MRWRFVLLSLLVACAKADAPASGEGGASTGRDRVIAVWRKAGLETTALSGAAVDFGTDCQRGSVSGLDVLLCQYASADAAKAAESVSLGWIGATTGAAWASDNVLIAIADRGRADPNGRTINRLMKLAPP
jgi:hypothetical protein